LTAALATLAALGFAASAISARLGLRDTGLVAAVLISNGVATVILIAALAFDLPMSESASSAMWFALAGLLGGPGLASAAILVGLRRLGPPTHVPLQGGAYGVVIAFGAAFFLSETVGARKAIGVAAIVIGAGWLVRAQARVEVPLVDQNLPAGGSSKVLRAPPPRKFMASIAGGLYLPLIAGAMLAGSDLIAKWRLKSFPQPMFAAAVGMTSGTLAWALAAALPTLREQLRVSRHSLWLVGTGTTLGIAYAALNTALNRGDASTVGPIVATEPLAVILLSTLFLSALHRVTWRMVLAGLFVVGGSILVSV